MRKIHIFLSRNICYLEIVNMSTGHGGLTSILEVEFFVSETNAVLYSY